MSSRFRRPIPNHKITIEPPANSEVIRSYMDPAEMIRIYGAPTSPLRKRYRA